MRGILVLKSINFASDYLKFIFNKVAMPAVTGAANFYLALHWAEPTATQDQNEISYTGYARVPVPVSIAGWAVTGNSVSPVNNIVFAPPTALGAQTRATYASLGLSLSGTSYILYKGALNPYLDLAIGTPPTITTSSRISEL